MQIVLNPQLALTTASLPAGVIGGQAYNQTLAATGGMTPYTWTVTTGSLPAGLSLNASTGALTGTPTSSGTFNFTAKVTDSESPTQSVTASLSVTIIPQLQVQTSGSLPTGIINVVYSGTTLQATGGVTPYTWSYTGNLPPGMNLNASTGVISGTPTSAGTFSFTAAATDSGTPQQTATASLSITVRPPLAITTTTLATGAVSSAYNQSLAATGEHHALHLELHR